MRKVSQTGDDSIFASCLPDPRNIKQNLNNDELYKTDIQ